MDKITKSENTEIAVTDKAESGALSVIKSFEDVERLATYVANSPAYNKAFIEDSGDGKGQVVSKESIIACIILGQEMGFSPMQSIIMGKRLNQQALVKVQTGRTLGIDPMVAMQQIYIWSGKGGQEIVYTGIHIVNAALSKAKIKREIIEDGTKAIKIYKDAKSGIEIEYDPTRMVIMNDGIAKANLEEALKAGRLPVLVSYTKRATVRLTRGKEEITMSYSLQQAIDAGLYKGKSSDGEDIKGKDNWNAHPATHLIKMAIMLAARIIASDVLQGTYISEELSFTKTDRFGDAVDVDYTE